MNKFIAKNLVYFPIQRMRGQRVKEYLPQVRAVQFQSLDEINTLRDEKLQSVVNYAYTNIPFYKERFDKASVRPEEIKGIGDLGRLPVLSKREILENEKALVNPNFQQKLYTRKTGGSTGMIGFHFTRKN